MTEADTNPEAPEAAAAAAAASTVKLERQHPTQPAYLLRKAAGELGSYKATHSNSSDQEAAKAAKAAARRWGAPVPKDVLPYPKPQPAFPAVAVPVEPSAPLMPEEYPSA